MPPRPAPALPWPSPALAICQPVLRGVAEADYHKPTVCTEFDVTQLAEHLIDEVAQRVLGVARQIITPEAGRTNTQ